MTKKQVALLGALLLALIVATGLTIHFTQGDNSKDTHPSTQQTQQTPTPSASPAANTVKPLKLRAKAHGGENTASFTITSNRAATGNLVLKAGGKTVKTVPFTTSKTPKGFTTTVTAKKLTEGVLTWTITTDDTTAKPLHGKVTITKPAPVKDACPNGDYTGNTYDGHCGSKPATPKPSKPSGGSKGSGPTSCDKDHTLATDDFGKRVCWPNIQH